MEAAVYRASSSSICAASSVTAPSVTPRHTNRSCTAQRHTAPHSPERLQLSQTPRLPHACDAVSRNVGAMEAAVGAVAAAAGSAAAGSGEIPWLNVTGASFVPSAPEFASHAPKLLHLVWVRRLVRCFAVEFCFVHPQLLFQASSCLSILGAGFIVLSYWLFPDSRKVSRTILMFLSIADLGSAGTWVWSTFITTQLSTPSPQCVIQGFVLQFFYLSSYVWTSCFAFHLYQLIWKRNSKVFGTSSCLFVGVRS